jgi:hypothetical protein
MDEEYLGLLALDRQRGVHIRRVDCTLEWRIGENHVVGPLFGERLGKSIGVTEVRSGDAVEHEVHAADAEHGHARVRVKAGQGFGLAELIFFLGEFAARQAVGVALFVVGDVARVGMGFEEVLPGVDEEAAGASGRVADVLSWARIAHVDHHADDVARRAELAVLASGVELAEQVLVEVALHVLVLRRNLHGVDGLAGLNEQAGLVDLELGVFHLGREGAARAAEGLDEGKDSLLDVLERLVGGKLRPVRPAEVGARKNGRELLAAKFGGSLGVLFALVEAFEEKQERQLLDGVEGIGQPAGPELVPESFDGGAECGVGEHSF